jgi:3',5'-cyclic AMP phosphodiesterase CpdA
MLIAHLSDTHFQVGPLGALPAAGLNLALGRLLTLEPRPDCVVITGDLADVGDPAAYADLHALLDRCPVPVHLTTGNHDLPAAMIAEFGGTRYLADGKSTHYAVEYPQATIIVADTNIPGSPAGRLGPEQLSWIDSVLAARPAVPAFLALHHPPTALGMPFLDGMRLTDGAELGVLLAKHSNVVRVLAGHVHRVVSAPFAGSLVTTAPSTYRQANLRLHDDAPPGYLNEPTGMLLHVLSGKDCVTHTVSVSHAGASLAF